MPVQLYAHLTWTTFGRFPLIDANVAGFLCRFLLDEAKRHGVRVVEIGVVSDHVHLLLELPPAYDIPRLVQGLKGASARIANRDGVDPNGSREPSPFRATGVAEPALQRTGQRTLLNHPFRSREDLI